MSDTEQRIRERAYQLWQQAGCPDGRSEEFWSAARRELLGDEPTAMGPAEDAASSRPGDRPARERVGAVGQAPRSIEATAPQDGPVQPEADEAPASPLKQRQRRPVRSARVAVVPGTRKAASSEDAPPAGAQPGKPARRPRNR
ncbi:MAG: DUF2934 domain-containing protein [Rhodospirillales bacterium]|nr:DUF2934 domain-containing protein [Rhodospirillales bacterium]